MEHNDIYITYKYNGLNQVDISWHKENIELYHPKMSGSYDKMT